MSKHKCIKLVCDDSIMIVKAKSRNKLIVFVMSEWEAEDRDGKRFNPADSSPEYGSSPDTG